MFAKTHVSAVSLRQNKPDAEQRENHSKSAHISQRSFLYGVVFCFFFNIDETQTITTEGTKRKRRRKKGEKTQHQVDEE